MICQFKYSKISQNETCHATYTKYEFTLKTNTVHFHTERHPYSVTAMPALSRLSSACSFNDPLYLHNSLR